MARPPPDDPTAASTVALEQGVTCWRTAHPDATPAEIERGVDRHLRGYRAALITSAAADPTPDERPRRPDWGRGPRHSRRLGTTHGGELTLTDAVWRCPASGAGLSPPR